MTNTRPFIVIGVSVVMGVVAVILASQYVQNKATLATTHVVVASKDLPVGTKITPEMVQVVDWPTGVSLTQPFAETEKVNDRVVTDTVLKGEPVLAAKLAPPGERGGISAVLAEGKRAITVKVNEIAGVAGFALPGNYVDVMVNTTDEQKQSISKIVLERILVLAVAQESESKDNKPKVVSAVTLEVTPQEAENIDLARSIGSLSLVLRNQLEARGAATAGARKKDLIQLASANGRLDLVGPAAPAAAPATPAKVETKPAPPPRVKIAAAPKAPVVAEEKVEIIRGSKKSFE